MPTSGQDSKSWIKGIQRLTGTPGNQSPAVKEILETPTPTDPHPEQEVPDGPVVERKVVSEGGKDAKEGNETTEKGGEKATDSNDAQRTRGSRRS